MRRTLLLFAASVIAVLSVAAPAAAQARDPFDPLVDESAVTNGTVTGTTTIDGETDAEVGTVVETERLANTGSEVQPWLVVAYTLVAMGAAALVLARTRAPVRRISRAPVRRN